MLIGLFVILLSLLFLLLLVFPYQFRKKTIFFYLPASIAVFLTIGMVLFPKEAFQASLNGLAIWWNIVFPALLPFFILSQVLIGLGVVHFLGVLLEPVMRPVFNVPGAGSFVMAMGLASGFPIGAVLTAKLRQQELCSKVEAERLLSFTNTADPLFMFGAVAVGMLHAPEAGIIIAIAHYLSSISTGLVMRFYKAHDKTQVKAINQKRKKTPPTLFLQAMNALIQARQKDGRPIGQLLGDAVRESVNTLMLIGGFIMLFSVIISLLEIVGLVRLLSNYLAPVLTFIGLDKALAPGFISGFFEIDLGCQGASTQLNTPLEERIIGIGAIIAWSGLSVHAQVASIISSTDINIGPYLIARVIHAILAGLYSMLILKLQLPFIETTALPVFWQTIPQGSLYYSYQGILFMGWHFVIILFSFLVISLFIYLIKMKN